MPEWLPKTNCRECGELTCLAFAVKLLSFEQKLENCKPLFTVKHSDLKKVMMDIAIALGHELPEP
jgi:ArsR family metal-binding transcriptional regulator